MSSPLDLLIVVDTLRVGDNRFSAISFVECTVVSRREMSLDLRLASGRLSVKGSCEDVNSVLAKAGKTDGRKVDS